MRLISKISNRLIIFRARYFSYRGDHARALAISKFKDVRVLSRAGMFLSVLKESKKSSIDMGLALAHLGQIDASFWIAEKFKSHRRARSLLGKLAVLSPERTLSIIENLSSLNNIKAYCLYRLHQLSQIDIEYRKLSSIHALLLALKSEKYKKAKHHFGEFFTQHQLIPPTAGWTARGIKYSTLACHPLRPTATHWQPKISIVLTANNEEKTIAQAIDSLLSQTWGNTEIIVVDDGSTDKTPDIVNEFTASNDRVYCVSLPENIGLWRAKNIGLRHCSGEIVTMHDADDWSHTSKLELQVMPLINNKNLLATSSYMIRIDETTGIPYTRNACNFLRWNPSSFMFQKKILKEIGNFKTHLLGGDCEFISRLEAYSGIKSHIRIKKPLTIGLQRQHSLSNRFRSDEAVKERLLHWESWRKEHLLLLK